MIKKEIIDQIREQSDIVQVIAEYLPLKKAGKYYRTLCPFHGEKSPSFYVSPERQIYHCFGCGVGGSVYTFLMQYEKLSFPEAIKKLASKLNITIETDNSEYRYQPLLDACEFATNFFQDTLQHSMPAKTYLQNRQISQETIKRFRLGFAPNGNLLINAAKKNGISVETLVKTGLAIKKENGYYDWFYNRITFPVFSASGKVLGFGARILADNVEPKYLNSPETPIFRKGDNLYGLFQAKNYLYQHQPILVEGNFDMLSLVDKGINNVIAPLGTAFTSKQALMLRRFSNQVVIAFDGDSSGRAATLRVIEIFLKNNLNPQVIVLPDNFDPDKYIKNYGKDGFENLITNRLDFVDYLLEVKPSETVSDKQARLKEIIDYIKLIDDNIDQELYINKTSDIFKISKDTLSNQIRKEGRDVQSQEIESKVSSIPSLKLLEKQILSLITSIPEFAKTAKQEIPLKCFSADEAQEIIQIIYDNIDLKNYTIAKLIDEIEKPALKQFVVNLSFQEKTVPTKNEFVNKLRALEASWYLKAISDAKIKGDVALTEKLSVEHYNLKKKLSQKRSK